MSKSATAPAAPETKPTPPAPAPQAEPKQEAPQTSLRERRIEWVFQKLKVMHLFNDNLLDRLMEQAERSVK